LSKKKYQKNIEHAEFVFQREQLQAATAAERLNKAIATVHEYKDELTEEQYNEALNHFEMQRKELEVFLTNARDKYVSKLKELGDPRINLKTGELL
jgi:DNA-binding NtrC family response regulator